MFYLCEVILGKSDGNKANARIQFYSGLVCQNSMRVGADKSICGNHGCVSYTPLTEEECMIHIRGRKHISTMEV